MIHQSTEVRIRRILIFILKHPYCKKITLNVKLRMGFPIIYKILKDLEYNKMITIVQERGRVFPISMSVTWKGIQYLKERNCL